MTAEKMLPCRCKLLLVALISFLVDKSLSRDIIRRCREKCITEIDTEVSPGPHCDDHCQLDKCGEGCKLWPNAVESSCLESCNESEVYREGAAAACVVGCNLADDMHADHVRDALGVLKPPVLMADTLGSHSAVLRWTKPHVQGEALSFHVQSLLVNYTQWQRHVSYVSWGGPGMVTVHGLKPYVTYRFRVAVEASRRPPILSPPSLPIATKRSGAPSGKPVIVSLTSTSSSIYIKWRPPYYKNGPLVSYRLTVTPLNGTDQAVIKEVLTHGEDGVEAVSEVVTMLQPLTRHLVQIAATNSEGTGPSSQRNCTTQRVAQDHQVVPYLIMGADHMMLKQNLHDTFEKPETLYTSVNMNDNITGVAVYYDQRKVFFSDNRGYVRVLSLDGDRTHSVVYTSANHPGALTTDWLHQPIMIYIAEENKITQCSLDGACRTVVDGLPHRPVDIKVDPCSGYLFWALHGRGLYRMDLADVTNLSHGRNASTEQIVRLGLLSTFSVDYGSYRVIFPNETRNSVMSVSLDGSNLVDIRPNNGRRRHFVGMKSMVYFNKTLCWTGKRNIWVEERGTRHNIYHHNNLQLKQNIGAGLNIWHPMAQPLPVPLLPPRGLQALFLEESMSVTWQEPDQDQGRGAWRQWAYQVEVAGHNQTYDQLPCCRLVVDGLQPGAAYSLRVRGYSEGGAGPWSQPAWGHTLQQLSAQPRLVYVRQGVVYESLLDGTDPSPLLNLTHFNTTVKDVVVYEDDYYLSLSNGSVLHHGAAGLRQLPGIVGARAISYDWRAHTLYWASLKHSLIQRRRLVAGSVVESIHQGVGLIQDLAVDSVRGHVYWTTAHSVQVARLDGKYPTPLQELPSFSGRYILGLVLSPDTSALYWMMKAADTLSVYRSRLVPLSATLGDWATGRLHTQRVAQFDGVASYPSLEYYSGKLLWLNGQSSLSVLDIAWPSSSSRRDNRRNRVRSLERPLEGSPLVSHSLASLSLLPSGGQVCAFSVRHNSTADPLGNLDEVTISPVPVDMPSNVTLGHGSRADNFTLIWERVDGHQVYYKLLYNYDGLPQAQQKEVQKARLRLTGVPPYTAVTVTLEACTSWGCGPSRTVTLYSPEAVPSAPSRLREYVTYHRNNTLESNVTIELEVRWSPPRHPNGVILRYVVFLANSSAGPWRREPREPKHMYYTLRDARHSHCYFFKVSACNSAGCRNQTKILLVNTKDERPVPRLLTTDSKSLKLFLPDENDYTDLAQGDIKSLTYIAWEDVYYWIGRGGIIFKYRGATQPFSETAQPGAEENPEPEKVVDIKDSANSLTVDWIRRDLYWVETKASGENSIVKLQLDQGSPRGDPSKPLVVAMRTSMVWRLEVDPHHSALYWTEADARGVGRVMRCSMNAAKHVTPVLPPGETLTRQSRGQRDACSCPPMSVGRVFVMDHSQVTQPRIYVINNATGDIWSSDIVGCECRRVVAAAAGAEPEGDVKLGLPPDSMAVDNERLYWTNAASHVINSVLKVDGSGLLSEQTLEPPSELVAYGEHLQPMPDPGCLQVGNYSHGLHNTSITKTTIALNLTRWQPRQDCGSVSLPRVKYIIYYRYMVSSSDMLPCDVACPSETSFSEEVVLRDLQPYSWYQIQVKATNYYMDGSPDIPNHLSAPTPLQTLPGVPSVPWNVTAEATTAQTVRLTWMKPESTNGPESEMVYKITWLPASRSGSRMMTVRSDQLMEHREIIKDLDAAQMYKIKIVAYNQKESGVTSPAATVFATTPQYPPAPKLISNTPHSINLSWWSPSDDSVIRHNFGYIEIGNDGNQWQKSKVLTTANATFYVETIDGLKPNSEYALYVSVVYKPSLQHFRWPQAGPQGRNLRFKTLVSVPSTPAPPVIENDQGQHIVKWETPGSGGSTILEYTLACRVVDQQYETNVTNWTVVYSGSNTHWRLSRLDLFQTYIFRVSATNMKGDSEYSAPSADFHYTKETGEPGHLTPVLASSLCVVLVLILITIVVLLMARRQHQVKKLDPPHGVVVGRETPDMELANLRELPRVTIQTSNALYAIKNYDSLDNLTTSNYIIIDGIIPTDEDVAALPHYRRDHLTLTKFLGSGAFGEVFEGIARNIISDTSGETRVAVKTLRKGATDQEKEEFLKEALLMSNFKHDHILRLLGVCLDNDPQFIILELMEAGDLLSFLRSSRPTPNVVAKLNLSDMVCICVDVARGCKYLEDMHFVHRDLAARNCLVSNCDKDLRQVKIGDFGLARDIYKSDYYRKEGEGLLPVRWMSPESLIDGVFTTQSDVWSFGVLMWEVLTLGQQPYPARTNIDVLHYVRGGGRLDRPDNCPDDLYNLMLKCWTYVPDERPSFQCTLSQLEKFKRHSLDPSAPVPGYNPDQEMGTAKLHVVPPSKQEVWQRRSAADAAKSSHHGHYPPPLPLPPPRPGHQGKYVADDEDSHGYLEPLKHRQEKHKYLQLIDGKETGSGQAPSKAVPNRDVQTAASKPQDYLQLADAGSDGETTAPPGVWEQQDASGGYKCPLVPVTNKCAPRPAGPGNNGNGRGAARRSKVCYSQLADSDHDSNLDSDDETKKSRSSRLRCNISNNNSKREPSREKLNNSHSDTDNCNGDLSSGAVNIGKQGKGRGRSPRSRDACPTPSKGPQSTSGGASTYRSASDTGS